MTKCDFCANCSPDGKCLGQEATHKRGNDIVRYCSDAVDRYLKYCERKMDSRDGIEVVKGSLNV